MRDSWMESAAGWCGTAKMHSSISLSVPETSERCLPSRGKRGRSRSSLMMIFIACSLAPIIPTAGRVRGRNDEEIMQRELRLTCAVNEFRQWPKPEECGHEYCGQAKASGQACG